MVNRWEIDVVSYVFVLLMVTILVFLTMSGLSGSSGLLTGAAVSKSADTTTKLKNSIPFFMIVAFSALLIMWIRRRFFSKKLIN